MTAPDHERPRADPYERVLLVLAGVSLFLTSVATGAGGVTPLAMLGALITLVIGTGWLIVRVQRGLSH